MSDQEVETSDAIQVPSTPPATSKDSANRSARLSLPPAGSMTPPPSAQPRRFQSPLVRENTQALGPEAESSLNGAGLLSLIPSPDIIDSATVDELRTMVQELIAALTDARMSAAHFKLQHTLLIMETHEAAQRAEVEHQMARREVEAMQFAEQRHRAASATPKPLPSPQPQIAALTKTCQDLEDERDEFEDQLKQTQKHLEFERGRAEMLAEQNLLLKKRIRENREHFTKLRDHSPMYNTPRQPYTTPRRKSYSRFADHTPAHDNFAALLYADQMLSQETASVPSTPTKSQVARAKQGHIRGAHSLSSLQTTPARRTLIPGGFQEMHVPLSAPGLQLFNQSAERERHDRDSTISISEAEEEGSTEDVVQSQASSLATDMLRRNPASQASMRQSQDAERSSNRLQTKLFGKIKKASNKRPRTEDVVGNKKPRLDEGAGLGVGIDRWNRASS